MKHETVNKLFYIISYIYLVIVLDYIYIYFKTAVKIIYFY